MLITYVLLFIQTEIYFTFINTYCKSDVNLNNNNINQKMKHHSI